MVQGETRDAPARNPFANPEKAFDFGLQAPPKRRASPLDWIALALAVLAPPIGLITSVVARLVSRAAQGWSSKVARAATVVSVILSLALGAGGVGLFALDRQAAARAELVAQTVPLCTMVDAHPGILTDPAFGWPQLEATIPESLATMTEYAARWQALVPHAPKQIAADVEAVAKTAQSIVTGIETSRTVDGNSNLARMQAIAASSTLPTWVAEYCVPGANTPPKHRDTPGIR